MNTQHEKHVYTVTQYNLYAGIPEDTTLVVCKNLGNLKELPTGIFDKCTKLEKLECNYSELEKFPHLNFPLLRELYCNNNYSLQSFPPINAPLLRVLYCGNNCLTELPSLDTPLLEILCCDDNRIHAIPPLNLPLLKDFDCSGNVLYSLPILNTPLLKELYCGDNYLQSFPSLDTPLLISLYCDCNLIQSLPPLNTPLLKELICRGNKLTKLPSLDMPLLTSLICGGNSLQSLPSLSKCTLLKELDYDHALLGFPLLPSSLEILNNDDNPLEYTLSQLFLFQQVRIIIRCKQFTHKLRYREKSRRENVNRLELIDSIIWRPPHLRTTTLPAVDLGGIHFQEGLEDTLLLLQE